MRIYSLTQYLFVGLLCIELGQFVNLLEVWFSFFRKVII